MDNTLCDAVYNAKLDKWEKFTLLTMIRHIDNHTKETFVSQEKMSVEMGGVSHDTISRAQKRLVASGVLEFRGTRPTHPGSVRVTNVYKIHLWKLQDLTMERSERTVRPDGDRD